MAARDAIANGRNIADTAENTGVLATLIYIALHTSRLFFCPSLTRDPSRRPSAIAESRVEKFLRPINNETMSIVSQTLQGAVLSITSNVLAQAISSYKDSTPFALNYATVFKFALFSVLSTPPNIVWQGYLEDQFPTNVPSAASTSEKPGSKPDPTKTSLSKTNVLIKFLLDQTIGAVVNTLMFLSYMAYVNAQGKPGVNAMDVVTSDCANKLWPMMKDGYKFWPAISLISFLWVPVDKRIVFGCSVGVVWGIYLSLAVGA